MDGDFFFVMGIVLVLAAVGLAFVGIRGNEQFPPNRLVLAGVTALFAAIVATTMAFAVVKSKDEQDKRNEENATEQAQAGGAGKAEQERQGAQPQAPQGGVPSETLEISSPADGGLLFQPDGVQAKPGNLTITYDNPSPVPHSIAVATANGNVLGETTPAADGKQTLDVTDLSPGKYIFYCTVPGHREAGMEGNLTVTGGPTP